MPKRQVFFSFHYEADAWRAAQVRNMGVVEGNEPVSDNASVWPFYLALTIMIWLVRALIVS